jgi:hypothetical protein
MAKQKTNKGTITRANSWPIGVGRRLFISRRCEKRTMRIAEKELLGIGSVLAVLWVCAYTRAKTEHARQNIAAIGVGVLAVCIVIATYVGVLTATVGVAALTGGLSK